MKGLFAVWSRYGDVVEHVHRSVAEVITEIKFLLFSVTFIDKVLKEIVIFGLLYLFEVICLYTLLIHHFREAFLHFFKWGDEPMFRRARNSEVGRAIIRFLVRCEVINLCPLVGPDALTRLFHMKEELWVGVSRSIERDVG